MTAHLQNAFRVPSASLPRYMSLTDWWAFYCPFMLADLGEHSETAYEPEKAWLLETSAMLGEDVCFRDATVEERAAGVCGPVPLFRRSLFMALPDAVQRDGAAVDWAAVREGMAGKHSDGQRLPQAAE